MKPLTPSQFRRPLRAFSPCYLDLRFVLVTRRGAFTTRSIPPQKLSHLAKLLNENLVVVI